MTDWCYIVFVISRENLKKSLRYFIFCDDSLVIRVSLKTSKFRVIIGYGFVISPKISKSKDLLFKHFST